MKKATCLAKSSVFVDLWDGWCIPPGYTAALSDTNTDRLKSSFQSNHSGEQKSDSQQAESLLSKVSMWSHKKFETQATNEENVGRESSQTKNQKIKSFEKATRLDQSSVIVDLRDGWCIPPGYIAALRDTITGRLKSICESKHVVDQRSNVQQVESQKGKGGGQ